MGIKGLKKYLESISHDHARECLPKRSHLHIDATGWVFYLMRSAKGLDIARQFGGSYMDLDNLVRDSYIFLLDCGLEPIFYFDGRDTPMKKDTRIERNIKRLESQAAIYDAINSDAIPDQRELDLPPLTTFQFRQTLKSLGARITDCKYEADQEMVLACKQANSRKDSVHYCYGDDTDYLAMADCHYIPFGSIYESRYSSRVECVVWTREKTSRKLGMTEVQFVELCILIGNDYTMHFNRTLFNQYKEFITESGLTVSEVTSAGLKVPLDFILSRKPDFRLSSPNIELHKAIQYSRAVYNLLDLDVYDRAEKDSIVAKNLDQKSIRSTEELSSDTYKLSKDKAKSFDDWMLKDRKKEDNIGMTVIRFLSEKLRRYKESKVQNPNQSQSTNLFSEISDIHIEAFFVMLASIREKKSTKITQELDDVHKKLSGYLMQTYATRSERSNKECIDDQKHKANSTKITWPDAVAAHTYQLLCKRLMQNDALSEANPMDFYDGKIFHFDIQQIKEKRSQAMMNIVQKLKSSTNRRVSPQPEDPSPPRSEEHSPLRARSVNRIDDSDKVNPWKLAKCRKNLWKRSHLLGSIRIELTMLYHRRDAASEYRKAELYRQRSITRSKLAETVKLYDELRTGETNPPPSTRRLPVIDLSASPTQIPSTQTRVCGTTEVLPIDKYKEDILRRVGRSRISVIGGETGCGKSSRLPVMLLEDAESRGIPCRIMVSQPRRIAASALMRRLRVTLGGKVGLRMGEGMRDETPDTVITFVTCGYMVRLMSHNPESLQNFTHIIIDEVHERSVDGDVACMLSKGLLKRYPAMRLVLMSATLNTGLYRDYFREFVDPSDLEPLFVGVKRFNITFKYCEDILREYTAASVPEARREPIRKLIEITSKTKSSRTEMVPLKLFESQLVLVLQLVKAIERIGSDILIFVSGLGDIGTLLDKFRSMNKYQLCCIHSEIPFEDQRKAFEPALHNKIKIIIANNSAVSSVTFPDVDNVIDLGTHKCIEYSNNTRRSTLVNKWISKATAIQRAGRTGRVRDGTVYRLYSMKAGLDLDDFDEPEITSLPLENVILDIWSMMEDSRVFKNILTTLEDLPNPPRDEVVYSSLTTLESNGMITEDTGLGSLTNLGRFAGALPLDLNLGKLISYGIALGVGAESVVFAAALSTNSSLMRQTNLLMVDYPENFNDTVRKSFLGAVQLDNGSYSEPIMALNMYKKWQSLSKVSRIEWCKVSNIRLENMGNFATSVESLLKSVNSMLSRRGRGKGGQMREGEIVGQREEQGEGGALKLDQTALNITHTTTPTELNLYRLILTWVCHENIMTQQKLAVGQKWNARITMREENFSVKDLENLFTDTRKISVKNDKKVTDGNFSVPFSIKITGSMSCEGHFERPQELTSFLIIDLIVSFLAAASLENQREIPLSEIDVLPVIWITRETEVDSSTFRHSETELERNTSRSSLTIAYPSDIDAPEWLLALLKILPEVVQKSKWLSDTFAYGDIVLNELWEDFSFFDPTDNDIEVVRKYVTVEFLNVTKKQLMELSKLQFGDYPIAYMTISTARTARIQILNFFPPLKFIIKLFDPEATEEDEGKVLVNKIATISFPDCDTEGCITASARALSASTAAAEPLESPHDVHDLDPQNASPSLSSCRRIKDIPIGLRLLNAYCKAHSNTMLLIKPEGKQSTKITVSSEKGSWGVGIPAHLSRHSVPAAAVHTGPETLYGVAFSSLTTYGSSGRAVCMLGGVTILPPGEQWLDYALGCIGASRTGHRDPSCTVINTFLSGLKSLPINREEALINAINFVFSEWLDMSDE